MLRIATAAFCLANLLGSAALAKEGSLTLPDHPGAPVELTGRGPMETETPADYLRVYIGPKDRCCSERSPIAGRYSTDSGRLAFDPAFDFAEGQTYTIWMQKSGQATGFDLTEFTLGTESAALEPRVVAIYPSGPDIPENTLRFYVHFSAPMQPHRAAEKILLVNADGVADTAAFMTFKQELWNEDRTRLTLLLDPGRIKRGVAQNLTLGPALLEGKSYSLVVDEGWPSATSGLSAPRFERPFLVSAPLRTQPDPKHWDISEARAKTRDPLTVTFDRPFDRHQLAKAITVLDAKGLSIAGDVWISEDQTQWRFDPLGPWSGRTIELVVDPQLEDVAGNNFRELLDHALGTPVALTGRVTRQVVLGPAQK